MKNCFIYVLKKNKRSLKNICFEISSFSLYFLKLDQLSKSIIEEEENLFEINSLMLIKFLYFFNFLIFKYTELKTFAYFN